MFKKILMAAILSVSSFQISASETDWNQFFLDLKYSNYQRESVETVDKKIQATFYRNIKNEDDIRFAGFGVLRLVDSVQLTVNTEGSRFKHICDINRNFGEPLALKLVIKMHDFDGLNFKLKNGKSYTLNEVKNHFELGEIKADTQSDNDLYKVTLDKLIDEALRTTNDKNMVVVDLSNHLNLSCNLLARRINVKLTKKISYEKTAEFKGSYLIDSAEFSELYNSFWNDKEIAKEQVNTAGEAFMNNVLAAWNIAEKGFKKEEVLKGRRLQDIVEALGTKNRIKSENSANVDGDIYKQWLITLEYKIPTSDDEKFFSRLVTITDSSADLKVVTVK